EYSSVTVLEHARQIAEMSRWMPVHALYPSAAVDLLCCPTYTFPLNRLPRDRRVRMYFSLFKFLAGGHDVARTGAEGCAGVSGIALFGWRLSHRDVSMAARERVARRR